MARAADLTNRAAANRKKSGKGSSPAQRPRFPSFTGPPPGTFDPGLEAQVRSSQRGLLDLEELERLEALRGHQDTGQARRLLQRKLREGRADIGRGREYAQQDFTTADTQLHTTFARDLEELGIAKQRGEEDYQRTLTNLQHKYAETAAVQGEQRIQTGTNDTGTTAASAAVSGANQAFDRQGIDTMHQRGLEDLARREGRIRSDFGTEENLLGQDLGRRLTAYGIQGQRLGEEGRTQFHALSLAALRAKQDRETKLSHARREQGIYSSDVAQQAFYQAHQLNPNIQFPTPSAATAAGIGAHPRPPRQPHPPAPHVHDPVPKPPGLGPAMSRRPYTRY